MHNGETIRFIDELQHRLRMRRIRWIREQIYHKSIVSGTLKAAKDISDALDTEDRARALLHFLFN